MGFLTQALEKRASKDVAISPGANPPENWTFAGELRESGAGVTITPEMSLQISAVYACVRNLAEDVAKLPQILYRRTKKGKERAPDHPLYTILHDMPNPEMTSFDMRSTLQGHVGGRGNGYAYIEYDNSGKITEIWPLRPDYMVPYRDPVTKMLMYEYTLVSQGVVYRWPKERVFHLHGLGFDGIMGYNPVQMQMRSQGLAWATEEFGSRFFGNGARPGIVYKHPGQLSDGAYKHLTESMEERHTGLDRSHRIKILEEGMDVETIGTPPEEAQFLQTRKFQVTEIARWYRMPPHKIADLERATFSNIEEQSLEYVTDTLMPWLVRWEQAIYSTLLLPRERKEYFAEHLLDSMLRGKTLERFQAYHTALTDGWLNRNEVRESENRNQVEGLDEYLVQMNMSAVGGQQGDEAGGGQANGSARTYPQPLPEGKWGGGQAQDLPLQANRASVSMETLRPVVRDAAERIVRRESQDVGGALKRLGKAGDWAGLASWAERFWVDQAEFMGQQLGPVMQVCQADGVRFAGRWMGVDQARVGEILRSAQEHGVDATSAALSAWFGQAVDCLVEEFYRE